MLFTLPQIQFAIECFANGETFFVDFDDPKACSDSNWENVLSELKIKARWNLEGNTLHCELRNMDQLALLCAFAHNDDWTWEITEAHGVHFTVA